MRSFAGAFYCIVITQTRFSEKKRCEEVFTEGVDNLPRSSILISVRRVLRPAPVGNDVSNKMHCAFVTLNHWARSRTPFARIKWKFIVAKDDQKH